MSYHNKSVFAAWPSRKLRSRLFRSACNQVEVNSCWAVDYSRSADWSVYKTQQLGRGLRHTAWAEDVEPKQERAARTILNEVDVCEPAYRWRADGRRVPVNRTVSVLLIAVARGGERRWRKPFGIWENISLLGRLQARQVLCECIGEQIFEN